MFPITSSKITWFHWQLSRAEHDTAVPSLMLPATVMSCTAIMLHLFPTPCLFQETEFLLK